MRVNTIRKLSEKPIRRIKVVVDLEDPFKPELSIKEFRKICDEDPSPPRYRVISIEVVTCSEDFQPVLVSECGRCPKFFKRYGDQIFCKKTMSVDL